MKSLILLSFFISTLTVQSQTVAEKADSLIQRFPELEEDKRGRAFLYHTATYMINNIDTALAFIERIEKYGLENSDTVLLITSTALRAEYFWRKGDYQKGIEFALESVDLSSTHKRFEKDLAKGFQTAGTIHLYLNNREDALSYYRKANAIYESMDQIVSVASINNNSGVVYMDAADLEDNPAFLDSALMYFNKVIAMRERAKVRTLLNALGNAGSIHVKRRNWVKAQEIYDEWEEIEAANPNPTARSMHYGSIGLMHLELGDLSRARSYLTEGLELSIQFDSKFEMQEYYLHLSELYARENQFEQALSSARTGWSLKDSIFNAEKVNKINELEEKYQAAEREKEIVEANAEIEKKERLQTFLLAILVLTVIFSAIAIFLVVQRFRLRRALLSQEIDNLRLQISTIFSGRIDDLELSKEQIDSTLEKPLSAREYEILNLALSDKSNSEIAKLTGVSVSTIKFHLKNAYQKLGVSSRKEALEFVINKNE